MILGDLDPLLKLLGRLPGVGPRSARRLALELIQNKDSLMRPLAHAMLETADAVRACEACGNLDTQSPCRICESPSRSDENGHTVLCVVESVSDLWALERSGSFKGRYHVLGGTLSALDGRGPDQLRAPPPWPRCLAPAVGGRPRWPAARQSLERLRRRWRDPGPRGLNPRWAAAAGRRRQPVVGFRR